MGTITNSILRSFKRNRFFLFINITGLAIGLGVALVLLLFVITEISYDRHFDNNKRIFQLNTVWMEDGKRTVMPINIRDAYTDLPAKVPGIEAAVQIYRGFNVEVLHDNNRFQNIDLFFADPEFFKVFSMNFLAGTPDDALEGPARVVITDAVATKVFGSTDAVGKTFAIEGSTVTVTAVVEKLPQNTHFSFDVLASMVSVPYLDDLNGLEFFTYYLLNPGVNTDEVCAKINRENSAMLTEGFSEYNSDFDSETVGLTDIYLRSDATFGLGDKGSMASVLILAGLALLILLLAVTNFINLFVVQGDARALEVGIRKVSGAGKKEIVKQFFAEATVIVMIAFVIGIGLAEIFSDPFSSLTGKKIEPSMIFSPLFITGIVVLLLLTIALSAGYPAFYLSRFRPVEVLKKARKSSKRHFTTVITLFQSVITITLISVIFIVNRQIKYLSDMPKGLDTGHVMILPGINDELAQHYESFRQDMENTPGIEGVSGASHVVGGGTSGQGIYLAEESDKTYQSVNEYRVLPGLCELMRLKLVEGRFFDEKSTADLNAVVINEAAATMLGIAGEAANKQVIMFDKPMNVIGVVKDFYYESPAGKVAPMVLTDYERNLRFLYIRFNENISRSNAAEMVTKLLQQYDPAFVINPFWCDDIYGYYFERERDLSDIVTASTILSLIIALMGLFAIHAFSAMRRTKEIGVRKVLGESSWSVMIRLLGDVVKWVFIAGIVAAPLSYVIGKAWLGNYANRTGLGIFVFIAPVCLQMLFALIATAIVSARASLVNPADALRYE